MRHRLMQMQRYLFEECGELTFGLRCEGLQVAARAKHLARSAQQDRTNIGSVAPRRAAWRSFDAISRFTPLAASGRFRVICAT